MADKLYVQLREKIDQISGTGFPATESGVEINILKKLFTEDEAQIYLGLEVAEQSIEILSKNMNRDAKELESSLERMIEKGLVFPMTSKRISVFMISMIYTV